jgi:adenine-specific DNA-methyltransferase
VKNGFYTEGPSLKKKIVNKSNVKEKAISFVAQSQQKMVKKITINECIEEHGAVSVAQHLVYAFLTHKNLDYAKSAVIAEYFNNFDKNPKLYFYTSDLPISTIKELEKYLELIIPIEDRKLNGAFFTPDYIIDFIISELQPKEAASNLDPSCGCGAFLLGLVDYYRLKFGKSVKDIVKNNIYGADILDYNIQRTKLLLAIYGLEHGEIVENEDFNLYHQDSLKAVWTSQFDNIVGNPPYVKFQDLSEENRLYLVNNWTTVEGGTFNLYFAFFELGYKLLKSDGQLGYITPNNYFTSLAGEAMRRYFQQKKCVARIIDFSHKKVFDAQTYTALTFLNKKENDVILFDRIKDNYTPIDFLAKANGSPNYVKDLNAKKWRLLKTDEQDTIKALENNGTPIGKLFDICVGIATLKDAIFFVEGIEKEEYYIKTTDNGRFEIEIGATRPVYKISDFKSQEDTMHNTRKVIFPYIVKNGVASLIPEAVFQQQFPKCYAYLLTEKTQLLERDKGKIKSEPFYAWGRTQGLTKLGKKILTPTFSQFPRFLVVEENDAFFTNGYGFFFKDAPKMDLFAETIKPITKVENIDVVQKILNSHWMHYYVSKTSVSIEGGYPCYQKNFIERFTIPELTEADITVLRQMTDKNDIDDFLGQKYQLKQPFYALNLV